MKPNKKTNTFLLIACLVLFLSLPGLAAAKIQLKFAHENNTSSAIQLQVEVFFRSI